jgi:hypothetical protein
MTLNSRNSSAKARAPHLKNSQSQTRLLQGPWQVLCTDNLKQSTSQCRAHNSSYHYFEGETPPCLKVIGKNTRILIALKSRGKGDRLERVQESDQLFLLYIG